MPDQLSSLPRVDLVAFELQISTDVLLGLLRHQDIYLNPGDRVPREIVYNALQANLDEGIGWASQRIERVT